MGGIGRCCCIDKCKPSRIAYTYGEGVVDLDFEMLSPVGTDQGTVSHFGKTAQVCQFVPTQTACSPALSPANRFFLESAWKWFDETYDFKQTLSIPNPTCSVFEGWQRFQTWLTLVSATVQIGVASDGTYHISCGAILSQTKSKTIWGTVTYSSNSGGICETGMSTSLEATAVPYCRNDSACTTGGSGTCCFSGGAASGIWGAGHATPGVYYDTEAVFAATVASGWISFATPMVATVSDVLYEFRQDPVGSQPEACRIPTDVTSTNLGDISWTCGTCPQWNSTYTFTTPRSQSLTHRLTVEW
jgi:hypothetical protein